jgi:hypothetical protein
MRSCAWCRQQLDATKRCDTRTCSKRCRQALHRFGREASRRAYATLPRRVAYADPPYPGLARRYYAEHPDYAGEVDHAALLSRLQRYDTWALSTSSRALPVVLDVARQLGLTPSVAAWFRGMRSVPALGPLQAWEPVVYAGARQDLSLGFRADATICHARPRATDPGRVVGAKPARFCYWLFELLGALPGDSFDDLFPGSGGVSRAWGIYVSRAGELDVSPPGARDASRVDVGDA